MEAAIHEKDDLRCFMTVSGEHCVQMDSATHQQESFAICSVLDTLDDGLLIYTVMVLS